MKKETRKAPPKVKKGKRRRAKSAEPSPESLEAMPEVDFTKSVRLGRGLHARRIAQAGGYYVQPDGEPARFVHTRQGRPKKGSPKATTKTKNVRLPPEVWEVVERVANDNGLSLHAAMRQAVLEWLSARTKVA